MRISKLFGLTLAMFTLVTGLSFAQSNPVRLVLWGGVPPESGPQMVVDSFNKEFASQGLSVEYERYVNDEAGNIKLDTNLLGGSDIDLYISYVFANISKRVNSNMALDMSELMKRDKFDLKANIGSLGDKYYVNGKPYSIPTTLGQNNMLVNKDMFDAAGIKVPTSWTYDEFRAIAKKLTKGEGENKVYGMFFNSQQDVTYPFQMWTAMQVGGDFYYKAGGKQTSFTDAVNVKTYKLWTDMMMVDKSAPTHVDSVTQKLTQEGMFLSGKAAMTYGSWIVRSVKDLEKYPHTFMTAVVPYPAPDKNAKYYNGGLGDQLMINPKSKNIEAAWTFAKWYATKGMLPMAKFGRFPAYAKFDKEAALDLFMEGSEKVLDRDSVKSMLLTARPLYALQTITTKLPEITKVAYEEAEAILLGKKTPEVGMADAKKRADAFLK